MSRSAARVFVSPCGTSLLTNATESQLRQLLIQTANCKEKELTPKQKQDLDAHIQARHQQLMEADSEAVKKLSAELHGIVAYYGGNLSAGVTGTPDQHFLLVSDTYQGKQVGDLVTQWLNSHQLNAQKVEEIPDIATGDRQAFRLAMTKLVDWCDRTLPGYQQGGWQVVFNLTGGFKSVNGFLQAVGMFYAHESVYIFQSSSELLRIPQLPIALDKEGIVGKHLQAFRKLGLEQGLSVSECEGIPETLLFQVDEGVEILSEWGELVWLQCKPQYYQQELLPPLSDQLVYSDLFQKVVNELPKDRLEIINERLDQLSRCLDTGGTNSEYNLKSLDFKPLKGKPFSDSTHECDAWSDRDAKRIYGHYESDRQFVIDCLGKHL